MYVIDRHDYAIYISFVCELWCLRLILVSVDQPFLHIQPNMDKMSVIDPEDMIFPRRWQMVMMLVSGVAIAYALRVNISIAAVKMESSLDWTGTQKGLVFSAFYIGYALGQMPSAFMTHWYGAKHLFGGSIAVTSVLTLFFPAVIKYNFGLGIFMRVVIGLTASATFPSCYYFYKSWIPVNEKTLMVSTIMSGVYLVSSQSTIHSMQIDPKMHII